MNKLNWLVPVCALVLSGCASKPGTGMDGADDYDAMRDGAGAQTWPGDGRADGSASAIGDDRSAVIMNERVVYFAFDSTEIDRPSIELLRQHARYLADNPGERVRLEGHTDERGSREYNIGLGERRAASVRSVLLVNGAAQNQLTTVSFGEERPADIGTGEAAWQLNRRVELVYER